MVAVAFIAAFARSLSRACPGKSGRPQRPCWPHLLQEADSDRALAADLHRHVRSRAGPPLGVRGDRKRAHQPAWRSAASTGLCALL